MKAGSEVTHFASKSDYLKKTPTKAAKAAVASAPAAAVSLESNRPATAPAAKVELSPEAKQKAAQSATPQLNLPKSGDPLVKPSLTAIPLAGHVGSKAETAKISEARKLPKTINRPAIFFIRGMNLNPFDDAHYGMDLMSKHIPGAELFGYDQEDKMLDLIQRRPAEQPIILLGHGLGGDTAVNLSQKLNSIERGYRKVELLVTMDSVGADNDIISKNVVNNLNFIPGEPGFFNDGPNIAKEVDLTSVINQIVGEEKGDIPEDPDVQFKIFDKINSVLTNAVSKRNSEKQRMQVLIDSQKSS
jgi:hypothetical protein